MRKQLQYDGTTAKGEFWMTLTDFWNYFNMITVCNFTPDVNEDGKTDGLSK